MACTLPSATVDWKGCSGRIREIVIVPPQISISNQKARAPYLAYFIWLTSSGLLHLAYFTSVLATLRSYRLNSHREILRALIRKAFPLCPFHLKGLGAENFRFIFFLT